MVTKTKTTPEEIGHLLRRAGFGGSKKQIDDLVALGYEESVERLMNASDGNRLPDQLVWRYHHEQSRLMGATNPAAYWLYKLIGKETL